MKLSDLDSAALEEASRRTYQYEWGRPGSGVPEWERLTDQERTTYRKEVGASVIAYLTSLSGTLPSSPQTLATTPPPSNDSTNG